MSYSVLEPTEQLAPTAWMGNSRSARTTAAGVRPKNVTPSSVNATWVTIGRSVSERMASTASRISTGSEKVSTTKASTPPSSNPSACSRKAACASSGSSGAEGRQVSAERPDGAQHEDVAPHALAGVAGQPRPAPVDLAHAPGGSVHAELEAVRPEGVGLDTVGACLDVLGVDALDELRIGRIQHVEAGVERSPSRVEHRPHGAVAEEGTLGEGRDERRGHASTPKGPGRPPRQPGGRESTRPPRYGPQPDRARAMSCRRLMSARA